MGRWAVSENDSLEYDRVIVHGACMVITDSGRLPVWSKTEEAWYVIAGPDILFDEFSTSDLYGVLSTTWSKSLDSRLIGNG
jgi:hypothetical protein